MLSQLGRFISTAHTRGKREKMCSATREFTPKTVCLSADKKHFFGNIKNLLPPRKFDFDKKGFVIWKCELFLRNFFYVFLSEVDMGKFN